MTLEGKNSVTITIITAYRVSQVSMPQHGDGSTYHQQHMLMSRQGIKSPNPRGQFVPDIIIFINEQQRKDREIILMMDANEEIGINSKGIATLLSECSLTDLLQHRHPTLQIPVTYNRGTKTIDYILGTSNNTDILVLYKAQLHIAGIKKQ